jgi:hypothetical protein
MNENNVTELPPRMGPMNEPTEAAPDVIAESEVVKFGPGRLDADTIADLKKRRLLREQQEAVELQPVGHGETMIGVLTEEERILFTEMATLQDEINEAAKELHARSFEMIAHSVRKSETPADVLKNLDETVMFPTEEDAKQHFTVVSRYDYLRAIYMMSLRERYGHHANYGVRSGFSVVRTGYKYKLPDEFKNAQLSSGPL